MKNTKMYVIRSYKVDGKGGAYITEDRIFTETLEETLVELKTKEYMQSDDLVKIWVHQIGGPGIYAGEIRLHLERENWQFVRKGKLK